MKNDVNQLERRWKRARRELAAMDDQTTPAAVELLGRIDGMEDEMEYLSGLEWMKKREEDR